MKKSKQNKFRLEREAKDAEKAAAKKYLIFCSLVMQ
jgi:hypothetical protein